MGSTSVPETNFLVIVKGGIKFPGRPSPLTFKSYIWERFTELNSVKDQCTDRGIPFEEEAIVAEVISMMRKAHHKSIIFLLAAELQTRKLTFKDPNAISKFQKSLTYVYMELMATVNRQSG
jgi:hypothetical protein